jgi:NAD(P)-dependent dehydrogenase (short-subunit alcohol dehydrogenase family)
MSKAALIHMTPAMALEWGRYDITVNAICRGYIDTEMTHHLWQTEPGQQLIDSLTRKRVGQPQDLDVLVMMLCANESHFVNGVVIQADNGFSL